MEQRIANVIYSDPPMSWWKIRLLKAGKWLLAIVASITSVVLNQAYGHGNVFLVVMPALIVAFVAAIWWERRKRRMKRQRKVAERA